MRRALSVFRRHDSGSHTPPDQGLNMASRVAERESMSTAVRAIPREEISPAESLFLLVVDPDRWARDLSRGVRADMRFKVVTAHKPRAPRPRMEPQRVDVLLLDVRHSSQ